jgi:hypothetical protein
MCKTILVIIFIWFLILVMLLSVYELTHKVSCKHHYDNIKSVKDTLKCYKDELTATLNDYKYQIVQNENNQRIKYIGYVKETLKSYKDEVTATLNDYKDQIVHNEKNQRPIEYFRETLNCFKNEVTSTLNMYKDQKVHNETKKYVKESTATIYNYKLYATLAEVKVNLGKDRQNSLRSKYMTKKTIFSETKWY